jgi:hypothetical protein
VRFTCSEPRALAQHRAGAGLSMIKQDRSAGTCAGLSTVGNTLIAHFVRPEYRCD